MNPVPTKVRVQKLLPAILLRARLEHDTSNSLNRMRVTFGALEHCLRGLQYEYVKLIHGLALRVVEMVI